MCWKPLFVALGWVVNSTLVGVRRHIISGWGIFKNMTSSFFNLSHSSLIFGHLCTCCFWHVCRTSCDDNSFHLDIQLPNHFFLIQNFLLQSAFTFINQSFFIVKRKNTLLLIFLFCGFQKAFVLWMPLARMDSNLI